jgi:hypothetical protein
MERILTHTALTATLAVFAFAQTPQTPNPTTASPDTRQPVAERNVATPAGSSQTYRGILLDANCQAIQTSSTTDSPSSDASRSRTAPPPTVSSATQAGAGVPPAATTGATPPSSTDAAAPAAIKEAARGPLPSTTNIGGETSPQTAATTGVTSRQSGLAVTSNTNAGSRAARAGDNSPVTTYSGPTASAGSSSTQPTTTHIGGTDNPTGERSRSADAAASGTTVPEKYKDCRVTPTTMSFALMSSGRLYMIDDTNGVLRQRMSAPGVAGSDWQTVSITGDLRGDRISTSSVQ